MKLSLFQLIAVFVIAVTGSSAEGEDTRHTRNGVSARGREKQLPAKVVEMGPFAADANVVEGELATTSGFPREELLTMYGRSAAASGRFDVAAAAYATFLNEFGTDHPNAENVAVRLADYLFPFKYDEVNIVHTPSGPRLDPVWRMGYTPRPEHLRQAVPVLELAASLAQDRHAKGSVLFKIGWVHRVLDDWNASTTAWDRCAEDLASTKSAADALWLAAENLEWTDRPAEATQRLERLAREYPNDARIPAAIDRVEQLEAEAGRSAEWLSDPVAALKTEIEARALARTPYEVYRSLVQWLRRRGEREALIAVARWACSQEDWTAKHRIACRYDLVDALLAIADRNALLEAVERLREIVALASDEATAVQAAIRCARVLSNLDRYDEAERMMKALADRVSGSTRWEPLVLSEYADFLLNRGDTERAAEVLTKLAASHPDLDLSETLDALCGANQEEGDR